MSTTAECTEIIAKFEAKKARRKKPAAESFLPGSRP